MFVIRVSILLLAAAFAVSDGKEINTEEAIKIMNQSIPMIEAGAYKNLPHLKKLELENCGIQEIKAGAFQNLNQLTKLALPKNQIRELRKDMFENLASLETIDMRHNMINKIEVGTFDGMPMLMNVLLGSNELTELDDDMFANVHIQGTLDLSRNKLGCPSAAFLATIEGIQHLSYGHNNISCSCAYKLNMWMQQNDVIGYVVCEDPYKMVPL